MNTYEPVVPFSNLPDSQQKKLLDDFSYRIIPKGTILFEQDITRVDKLYILLKGEAQFYYRAGAKKILTGKLNLSESFGGISILFNNSVAIRTLEVIKEAQFVILDANLFFDLCKKNTEFQNYFAACFGKCMLHESFAAIIFNQRKDKEFNLPFFNRPIRTIFKPNIISCTQQDSIAHAAQKMSRNDSSAILIKEDKKNILGILTDADLKKKVVAKGLDHKLPVAGVMSSPVISIAADCQVFEAFLAMAAQDKRHLAVTGQSGDIVGILSEKDLITTQAESTYLLIKTVINAKNIRDLENIHAKLERMLLDPIKNGANPEYVTRLITSFSDAIIHKIIAFSLEKAGPAPCKFVFLTMGSEGREEQTLISDQDNAIVYEDTKDPSSAHTYFTTLANLICDQLNMAGYQYCTGNNMAKNSQWCQPLSQWKSYFNTWIRTSNPERLLHSSIFFDFRATWGDMALAQQLKQYLLEGIDKWPGFLRNMTENTLFFKPPITLFGKLSVQTKGPQKGALDIKFGMLPIVDFARIYALKNGITQTNTTSRLFRLYTNHAITQKEYTDLSRSYAYMMNLRFLRQITAIFDEQGAANNYIYPENLSALDQILLKEIFKMIEKLQQKLSIEFTGVV